MSFLLFFLFFPSFFVVIFPDFLVSIFLDNFHNLKVCRDRTEK